MSLKMKLVIGLGHRARAGKDTVADHLVKHHGFVKMALADKLKQSVNLVLGWDDEHAYGKKKELVCPVWNKSPRWVYQQIGTEGWRTIMGYNVWTMALLREIERMDHDKFVITDVRFMKGEVETLTSSFVSEIMGIFCELWHISNDRLSPLVIRPDSMLMRWVHQAVGVSEMWAHQSEVDLHGKRIWNRTIQNNGSLDELYASVDEAVADPVRRVDFVNGKVS